MDRIKGTGVALVTPFKDNKEVDYPALEKLLNFVCDGGVDFIVVFGTTGEPATMSCDEKNSVVRFIIDKSRNLPIVLGIGGNNSSEVVNSINSCEFLEKIDAILSVVPFYNKPTQEGIYQHFKFIHDNTKVPILMYNVPGRTAVNMSSETCLRCANNLERIIGIKEASGNLSQVTKILKDKPDDFVVLSGDDELTLPIIACGGDGVISVVANAYPNEFSKMVNLCRNNNFIEARIINNKLNDIINSMFIDGNPAGVKYYLNRKSIISNNLRLPLCPVSQSCSSLIDELYKRG